MSVPPRWSAEDHLGTREGDTLDAALTLFLESGSSVRTDLAGSIRERVLVHQASGDSETVADALERLVSEGAGEDWPLLLARGLLGPAEARTLTVRLGAAARREPERRRLVDAIVRLGGGMAASLGAALAEESERNPRRAFLEALVALGPDAVPVAEAMTADGRWYVVRNALLILRDTAGIDALGHFTAGLGHEEPRVRREAVVALAHVGGEEAALLVLSKIPDPNRDVRQVAVRATGRFGQDRSVRPLLDRLEEEPDLEVLEEILLALGQIGDPGAVLAIERRAEGGVFSRRPPTSLRLAAYRALAAIGTPHARAVLEDASADRDDAVRDVVRRLMERT